MTDRDPLTTEQALAWFDSLEPVSLDFMFGVWRGEGVPTGHHMDGLLEATGWHGKIFESPEAVHPLVFRGLGQGKVRINPGRMPFGPRSSAKTYPPKLARFLLMLMMPFARTAKSRARLRLTEYRGQVSATMVYDQKPINDVFRKIDENSVLGLMDMKGLKKPFFFKLVREDSAT